MDELKQSNAFWSFEPYAVGLIKILMLLGALPIVTQLLGLTFLPSEAWVRTAYWPGLLTGLLSALFIIWRVIKNFTWNGDPDEGTRKGFAMLFLPIVGYVIGQVFILITVPMAVAVLVGQKTELQLTIVDPNGRGDKSCPSPVHFQNLPILFDEICRVPDEIRQKFGAGMQVTVEGYGTKTGIFPRTFH